MISLRRPSEQEISAQLRTTNAPFSYSEIGATADAVSLKAVAADYQIDRYHFPLGTGRERFERARASLLSWRHFEISWLELHGGSATATAGQVVATLTRVLGIWFLNPCRVVYTEGDSERANLTAFAYGTLHGHVERGEERFSVSFDPLTHDVRYEILAFSRPAVLLSKLGAPWARRIQRRFARSSAEAILRACERD